MKKSGNQVSMTGSELADLIEAYNAKIKEAQDGKDPELALHFASKLKGLLYDVRGALVYALRTVDVEKEIEAP